ncbi:MAG: pyridoxamine 5'-phosphate oxidase family protein [Dehalococcoidia bacterium]
MLRWDAFEQATPVLATAGRALLYPFGNVGLGFLSTVRADGGPRLHPVCPIIVAGGLYVFLIPSSKRADLLRDPRYALHSFPTESNEDAFYLTGRAERQTDRDTRAAAAAAWFRERELTAPPPGFEDEWLFELHIGSCLLTCTTGHGDYDPRHTVWRADPLTSNLA